jgi:alkylation response protein AidB-like acyl-CoA dehydrogenase
MDFRLTEEQIAFQKSFRKFCEKEIEPQAREVDEKEEFSLDNWKRLAKFGFFAIPFPEEYGGYNDAITSMIALEELSRVCASTALSCSINIGLCGMPLLKYGTEEQKKKYVTKIASGDYIGAFGLTEPNCGSDVGGIQTTAKKDGDYYILNGTKMFITNGNIADIILTFAYTDKSKGKKEGISAFIVEKNTEGFSVGKKLSKMGVRGSPTCELIFEDCKIPKENLVGEEGKGFSIAMFSLNYARISMAAWCLGIAQAAFEESVKYAETRYAFGRPIGYFQEINHKIAEMKVWIHTARLLIYYAAWLKNEGLDYKIAASIAKLFTSEIATKCCHYAVQIHGGYGLTKEYKVERLYRDIRLGEIGEGTSEVQRMIIAKELLKD